MKFEKKRESGKPNDGSSSSRMPSWLKPKNKDAKYYIDKYSGKTDKAGKAYTHGDFTALANARERHKKAFEGKLHRISECWLRQS